MLNNQRVSIPTSVNYYWEWIFLPLLINKKRWRRWNSRINLAWSSLIKNWPVWKVWKVWKVFWRKLGTDLHRLKTIFITPQLPPAKWQAWLWNSLQSQFPNCKPHPEDQQLRCLLTIFLRRFLYLKKAWRKHTTGPAPFVHIPCAGQWFFGAPAMWRAIKFCGFFGDRNAWLWKGCLLFGKPVPG